MNVIALIPNLQTACSCVDDDLVFGTVTFGTFMQQRREAAGMTRWKLGKLAGIGQSQLKGIEEGKGCSVSTAARLLKSLAIETINTEDMQV